MFLEKDKLHRQGRKLINKLQTWKIYKYTSSFIYYIFSFRKKFLITKKKTLAIISITVWVIFWKKIWYIDDFIVHKKARWKWLWEKIFSTAVEKIKKEDSDYTFLVSRNERKASHKLYKKFWFVIISLWLWILAYKKLKK